MKRLLFVEHPLPWKKNDISGVIYDTNNNSIDLASFDIQDWLDKYLQKNKLAELGYHKQEGMYAIKHKISGYYANGSYQNVYFTPKLSNARHFFRYSQVNKVLALIKSKHGAEYDYMNREFKVKYPNFKEELEIVSIKVLENK